MNGLSTALLVAAAVLFAASVVVAVLGPSREQVRRADEAPEPRTAMRPGGHHR